MDRSTPDAPKKKGMPTVLKVLLILLIIFVVLVGGCVTCIGGAAVAVAKAEQAKTESMKATAAKLAGMPADDIDPISLGATFNLMSKATDLQREAKEKEITGKTVAWTLPVFEVKRNDDGSYTIQTSSGGGSILSPGSEPVGTFARVFPQSPADDQAIIALKTGNRVKLKGVIAGVSMRHVKLEPAILIPNAP